jgi:hypothetical protein
MTALATATLSVSQSSAQASPVSPGARPGAAPAGRARPGPAGRDRLDALPPVHPRRPAVSVVRPGKARAAQPGQWQTQSTGPLPFNPDTTLLLMNGDVMAQNYGTPDWWLLKPSSGGSYLNGTWTELPPMPGKYAPYDYCSAVLANGDVVVDGGEYTYNAKGVATATETNKGAVYDPSTNSWQALAPPAGWAHIGDASCAVMPNGDLLLANIFDSAHLGQVALLNPRTFSWTVLDPPGKADGNSEENWTLLPDGTIFTVDVGDAGHAERYIPPWLDHSADGQWVSAGSTAGDLEANFEMGPAVLMPDGDVFATGASGQNAVYSPPRKLTGTGTWQAAPSFPTAGGQQLDVCDGPAILLPPGGVLVGASPGCYNTGDEFFTFSGSQLTPLAPQPPFGPSISSFWLRPLMLPTGQVLASYDANVAYIYTPQGQPNRAWAPQVIAAPRTIRAGAAYRVIGRQINGLSQDENYGDDEDDASNYPLVRITNDATGQVSYQSAYDPSSMGVATGRRAEWTHFTAVPGLQPGPSSLAIVANGITSAPVRVQVTPG